jgi:hypothetical protein
MAINHTDTFHSKALLIVPKLACKNTIWQPWYTRPDLQNLKFYFLSMKTNVFGFPVNISVSLSALNAKSFDQIKVFFLHVFKCQNKIFHELDHFFKHENFQNNMYLQQMDHLQSYINPLLLKRL